MLITAKDICNNCELALKRKNCSDIKFQQCYEEKADYLVFKHMLNNGIQRLSLNRADIIKILGEIYQ